MMLRNLVSSVLSLWLACAGAALAECNGRNVLDQLPPETRDRITAAAQSVPFASGNFWQARRDDQQIYLIGTYHLDDPRHDSILAAVNPYFDRVQTLLVEAGPAEEQALQDRVAADPSVIVNTAGPTLPEVLSQDDWTRLSAATAERGVPGIMAAKFKPWYITMLLSVPPCTLDTQAAPNGLDAMLVKAATARGLPVQALEPYDTVLRIFDQMSQQEQIDMILSSLAMESWADDLAVTLADTYFAEESRLIWELNRYETQQLPGYTPEKTDAELAVMEIAMMTNRNRAWIPRLIEAAAKGPVLAAFGALHLSGETGVLALLQAEGFTVERLPLP